MKWPKILSRIAFSPWFLAILPTLIIAFFLPPLGSKYSLETTTSSSFSGQMVYEDLNNDSISEFIMARTESPFNAIVVCNNDMQIYDQWNIPDTLIENISDLYFGDYDHNGFKEIYIFSVRGDSLFLNVNEFFKPTGLHIKRFFISKLKLVNNINVSVVYYAGFVDNNGDGKDEIYFGISSGFGQEPRKLYCFDLVNKKLIQTKFMGNIPYDFCMEDLEGDNHTEIFGSMTAPGNYKTPVPYSDSSTWLMVFDDKLNFKFPPVEFKGFTNGLFVKPFHSELKKYLVLLHTYGGVDTNILSPRIIISTPGGKFVRFRLLEDLGCGSHPTLLIFRNNLKDEIVLIGEKICILNENLEVTRSIEMPVHSFMYAFKTDVNADGIDELFTYSDTQEKLIVYSSNFDQRTEIPFKFNIPIFRISKMQGKDHKQKLFIKSGEKGYYFQLKKSRYYVLGYFAYPGIYLAFCLFILLIRRMTIFQLSQRENLKRRLLNLQLQSIKSQLDPHFTFNALNSIAALIYEDDRQSAYDHMNKFTQLLRRMLNDADRIFRSLKEELEFVRTYLDLEKLRFGEKFSYEIKILDGISQEEQVPKMVLQTFAENAIKHGILPRSSGGKLLILAEIERDFVKLTIEDNGIGRTAAAGQSTSTGKGLKITNEFYEILNQINKKPITHCITDLYTESGVPEGTRIEIWVPLEITTR